MAFFDFLKRAPKQQPSEDTPETLSALEQDLLRRLIEYGTTNDEHLVDAIRPVFARAVAEVPSAKRREMLMFLIETVESRRLTANALMPFLFQEEDWHIVSTAALHAAAVWHTSDEDPLTGTRELAGWARRLARDGDERRASAILAGLLLLGDRRIFECVGPCWRTLSSEGRELLAKGLVGRSHAGLVDFLVDWLEECEGGEFGLVASSLSRIPTVTQPAAVVDVRRALPVWSTPPDQVITVLSQWTFEEYGQRIRPRLLQIAADEQPPRIMFEVLKVWGIDNTTRSLAGIHMRPRGTVTPRDLLPLLGDDAPRTTQLTSRFIPLDDDDFVARDGFLLFSWSIFNPFGPTWSCVGVLPTENPDVRLLFYRMLNPFGQQAGAIGVVIGKDHDDAVALGTLVECALSSERVGDADENEVSFIGGGTPDTVIVNWEHPALVASVQRGFTRSPRLRALDVVGAVRQAREFQGRPWDRASAQLEDTLKLARPDGLIVLQSEGPTTDAVVDEWYQLVTDPKFWLPELINFPSAWHGAIDNTTPVLAQTAYTFWQLDDFLARYKFGVFRHLDRVRAEADSEETEASSAGASASADAATTNRDSYSGAYERGRKHWTQVIASNPTDEQTAEYALFGSIALQMARAQHAFADPDKAEATLRRRMHQPWALGYVIGTAFAVIEALGIPRESHMAESLIVAAHRFGIRDVTTADVMTLSQVAGDKPGYEEGMSVGGQDAAALLRDSTNPEQLLRWLAQ